MLTIGVISDTHGRLPLKVYEAFEDCDHIIHAGDIGSSLVLAELESIAPITAVLGNCDREDYGYNLPYSANKVFADVRIFVTHRPSDLQAALLGGGPGAFGPGDPLPQIAIHGHTHTPRKEQKGAILILCSGSPCYPRNSMPHVLLLTLDRGKILSITFVEL